METLITEFKTISNDKPPEVLFANITNACNLTCKHCYFSSSKSLPKEMPTEQWHNIIDQLADYGVDNFRINGGEPLIRKDVFELLEHAKQRGMKTTLITNSTMLTGSTLDKLKPILDIIYFSLDGAESASNDELRVRNGLYYQVINSIKSSVSKGINVGVFSSVSKKNSYNIENLIKILENLGVHMMTFYYCSPFGRAQLNWNELYINPKEWNETFDRIQLEVNKVNPKMKVYIEPRFRKVGEQKNAECSLYSKQICSIDPEGDVYFCSTTIDMKKTWSLGNLTKNTFKEIWEDSPKWDYIKSKHREEVGLRCTGCDQIGTCGGGCVASNLINHTEYLYDECGTQYYPICFMKWDPIKPKI